MGVMITVKLVLEFGQFNDQSNYSKVLIFMQAAVKIVSQNTSKRYGTFTIDAIKKTNNFRHTCRCGSVV